MAQDYKISSILKKVYVYTDGVRKGDVPLSYSNFKKIMMLEEEMVPVMTYERTVKEKYKLLKEFGFISKTEMLISQRVLEVVDSNDSHH